MVAQISVGAMDGIRQWIKYGVIIGAVIVLCLAIRKLLKKDVTLLGAVLAGVVALYIGLTRDVSTSSTPTLISVQNFLAYGGMAFGAFGAVYFYKSDKRFAVLCLIEALAMIFMTIGTDTGSIFFRVYMAMPAAIWLPAPATPSTATQSVREPAIRCMKWFASSRLPLTPISINPSPISSGSPEDIF